MNPLPTTSPFLRRALCTTGMVSMLIGLSACSDDSSPTGSAHADAGEAPADSADTPAQSEGPAKAGEPDAGADAQPVELGEFVASEGDFEVETTFKTFAAVAQQGSIRVVGTHPTYGTLTIFLPVKQPSGELKCSESANVPTVTLKRSGTQYSTVLAYEVNPYAQICRIQIKDWGTFIEAGWGATVAAQDGSVLDLGGKFRVRLE